MTKITKIASFFLLISGITFADPWRVPEDFPDGIQSAINYDDVVDGDTISVRQGTVQNPTIWYENIIFRSKDITVINRDFLPGGNNNPATCIIDGSELTRTSDSGSVVTFKDEESRDAVVKGFTIREGIGHLISEVRYGGGIFCYYSNPTVECCSIVNNSADWGGGIECNSSSPLIQYNMVRDDISNCAIHTQGACEAIIAENVITSNDHAGMWFDNGSPQVTANSITENQGYGIVASRCAGVFRRNTIQGNVIHGVYVTAFFPPDPEPDFGKTATSLGYNDIRGNEEYDFYNESDNPEVSAEGNYWGVIDSDSIRSNIFGNVDFDPILFYGDVDFWSRCYNIDVIVIGDITVKEIVGGIGGWLEISNGSLKFEPHSDTTKGGCDPNLCELIVFGEIIVNVATSFDYCYFISNSTSPQPGDWFGIRLMPGTGFNGIGVFRQSIIKHAHMGIAADDNPVLFIENSDIDSNQTFGLHIRGTDDVQISGSNINNNGVAGIYCSNAGNNFGPFVISGSKLWYNNRYGIMLSNNTGSAHIFHNQVTGDQNSMTPTINGIDLNNIDDRVLIESNKIEGWAQSGINCYETQALINHDTILNNSNGILCSENSNPYVRWCTIDSNGSGVFCEYNSYPNLGIDGLDPDSGNNSILMENEYWVTNYNPEPQQYIRAELNWWGTDEPDKHTEKFIGLVSYIPWLMGPPEGGGQSANIFKPIPTFVLYQPKPNPANGAVKINYALPNRCKVEFTICDVLGRTITNITEEKDAGFYEYLWQGKDQKGKEVTSGIYFIRLKAGNNLQTQKIAFAR